MADLVHARPIELTSAKRRTLQVVVREDGRAGGELRISSRAATGEAWSLHATARLVPAPAAIVAANHSAASLVRDGNEGLSVDDYYAALDRCGVGPGAKGRVLRELEQVTSVAGAAGSGPRAVVGKLMLPRSIESEWYAYHAHPLLLDAAVQLVGALFESTSAVRLRSVDSIEITGGIGSDCLCRAARCADAAEPVGAVGTIVADLEFFDRGGAAIGRIGGLHLEALPARQGAATGAASEWHRIEWVTADLALLEAKREVDRFILVSDCESKAAWLAAELNKHGVETRFCEKIEDLEPLVRILRANGDGRFGFLLLAWSDDRADAAPEPAFQREFRVGQWAFAIREHVADAAQIWIATRGLQPREGEAGAAARLASHVAREIDTFASCAEMQQCRLFDARSTLGDTDFAWLAALVGRSGLERQFRMASEGAQVPRLVAIDETTADAIARVATTDAGASAGVEANARALRAAGAARTTSRAIAGERNFRALRTGLEGRAAVALVACAERALAPDEVRVEVRAAGLTSFDVLAGLGLALGRRRGGIGQADGSRERGGLGLDFAGSVLEVGSRVADLAVGDRVVGIAAAAGSTPDSGFEGGAAVRRIVLSHRRVAALPERLDFVSAASLAWPGLVARHVLVDVARVRSGERVLVVSAGGGVGLSLVERARALGAEVHATACTPARRAALAEQGATIFDAADANDPGFGSGIGGADAERDASARFDVIIGSESGPVVHARIAALAPGGRYVDLCPRERFEREELGALRLGANRAVLAVDALSALESDGRGIGARLSEMMAELDEGTLETIAFERFPIAESARALRFMTQNRHTGRVVLDLTDAQAVAIEAEPAAADSCFAGREIVVSSDVRSRRGEAMRSALAEALRAEGAAEVCERTHEHAVVEATLRAEQIPAAIAPAPDSGAPDPLAVDLWIHIADEAIEGPDPLRMRLAGDGGPARVLVSLRGEVLGEADRDRAWEARLWVDRLLLAGGAAGAGASAAGLAALSVPSDATPESVLRVLEDFGRGGIECEQLILLPAAEKLVRAARAPSPLLAQLESSGRRAGTTSFDRAGFHALTLPERRAALLRHVRDELAGVLGLGAERRDGLDPALRLDALGLDSLMTMELFMGLGRSLELPLAADWFPPGPTLAEIAQVLVRRLEANIARGAA